MNIPQTTLNFTTQHKVSTMLHHLIIAISISVFGLNALVAQKIEQCECLSQSFKFRAAYRDSFGVQYSVINRRTLQENTVLRTPFGNSFIPFTFCTDSTSVFFASSRGATFYEYIHMYDGEWIASDATFRGSSWSGRIRDEGSFIVQDTILIKGWNLLQYQKNTFQVRSGRLAKIESHIYEYKIIVFDPRTEESPVGRLPNTHATYLVRVKGSKAKKFDRKDLAIQVTRDEVIKYE
jgi:hypothetical protein